MGMKVVLFCGGLGMRLREFSENTPKPMVPIGYRPIIWHLMRYYAHFGYKEFILCLGYRADIIKNYFINYNEWLSNDFVLSGGNGNQPQMLSTDIHDWKITFCETGINSNIAQRLSAVKQHLQGDEYFMANYSDNLSSLHLPDLVDFAMERKKVACLLSVAPAQTFHAVDIDAKGYVKAIRDMTHTGLVINGGFFVLRKDIFDYIGPGEELVHAPFQRLIAKDELVSYRYDGFFASMDTFKERQQLEDLFSKGNAPWEVWKNPAPKDPSPC
jgi:glucose-1-phosphate cytidylyltransferase